MNSETTTEPLTPSAGGKSSVRRAQFQMAQKNVVAAIWWGKQHLGQSDRVTLAPGDVGFLGLLGLTISMDPTNSIFWCQVGPRRPISLNT